MSYVDIHRRPGEESLDLYPGLVVSDGEHSRVTGSITIGRTRLPLWAVIGEVIRQGWHAAEEDYYPDEPTPQYHDFNSEAAAQFFYNLLEHRGEFGRLVLLLADVERRDRGGRHPCWYETKRQRKRLGDQLRRCLAILESGEP